MEELEKEKHIEKLESILIDLVYNGHVDCGSYTHGCDCYSCNLTREILELTGEIRKEPDSDMSKTLNKRKNQ